MNTLMLISHGELVLAKMRYATCEVSEKDGVDEGLSGTMLFWQHDRRKMKTLGLFRKDRSKIEPNTKCQTEVRGFDVTENDASEDEDTCLNPGAPWPFDPDYDGDVALKDLEFWKDGYAIYDNMRTPIDLFGDESVIGHNLSVFEDQTKNG